MKINGVVLNTFQTNFIKELMGDVFMTDTRAEAILAKLGAKHDVDLTAIAEAVNKNFLVKNAKLKELDALTG